MMYSHLPCVSPAAYQEYLLTLQARAMQGQLGGAHAARFDGLSCALTAQLLGLELVHLLAQQHAAAPGRCVHMCNVGFDHLCALQRSKCIERFMSLTNVIMNWSLFVYNVISHYNYLLIFFSLCVLVTAFSINPQQGASELRPAASHCRTRLHLVRGA